jgi:hypothetical protein
MFSIVTNTGYTLYPSSGAPPMPQSLPGMGMWASAVKLSPRGDMIAYSQDSPGRLVLQPSGGGPGTVIYQDGLGSPASSGAPPSGATWVVHVAWSPDESKIAITTLTNSGGPPYPGTVWTMNADGTNRQRVVDITGLGATMAGCEEIPHLAWDSNSRYLLITRPDLDAEAYRWDAVANTYNPTPYTSTGGRIAFSSSIQFSPDNSQIYWEDIWGQAMYSTANSPLGSISQIPFNYASGNIVCFVITQ